VVKRDSTGKAVMLAGGTLDITEKKKLDDLVWAHANFDVLTNLPNRRMFHDRLLQELKKVQRSGTKLALFFIDLDRFKEVNDTMGHAKGDALLVEAARRIVACVRDSDTVARMGGDEFTVILTEVTDTASVERVARNINVALSAPFLLDADVALVSACIGIALCPQDASEPEKLLKIADQAMYAAKAAGRNRYSYFQDKKA
jgi:diguanylate cyclase (GGDEF)-like protein